MEKLQKYCLSLLVVFLCFSCTESTLSIKGKRVKAEKNYKEASRLPQGSPRCMSGLARAFAIDSTFEPAVYELSVAYLKRGMPNQWKKYYDKAIALNPTIRIPRRGYLYLMFYRDYKKAIKDFNTSDSLTPYTDIVQAQSVDYWRGLAYLGLKEYDKSIQFFDKYITEDTKQFSENSVESTAFMYRGLAYLKLKNYDKAIKDFDKLLQYSNNLSADAKFYKAIAYKELGAINNAKIEIDNAIIDFKNGNYFNVSYVEAIHEIYLEDLLEFKAEL